MKKLIVLILLAVCFFATYSQSCAQSCDKKSCGPEGTKKEEAAIISTMRSDLQTVITKMSKSSFSFDNQLKEMTIQKGTSDDESLLYISQAATSIRYELLNKIEPSKLLASLKDYKPSASSTKQQMVANLKKEIHVLAAQAEKL
ncbi:MAG TPA: hypothetical protein VFD46_08805 [Chryseolinea sp.]|jgi:hypothetical protein|nr:hypothetical protein [Chryseolinea sp.]